jgi:hypothetical protein
MERKITMVYPVGKKVREKKSGNLLEMVEWKSFLA